MVERFLGVLLLAVSMDCFSLDNIKKNEQPAPPVNKRYALPVFRHILKESDIERQQKLSNEYGALKLLGDALVNFSQASSFEKEELEDKVLLARIVCKNNGSLQPPTIRKEAKRQSP